MQSFGPGGNVSSQAPPTADGWDIAGVLQGDKSQAVAWDLMHELVWSLSDSVSAVLLAGVTTLTPWQRPSLHLTSTGLSPSTLMA